MPPLHVRMGDPAPELSPGTCVLHDDGCARLFPEMRFVPAAPTLTRVVSRPSPDRLTFDLGYKACASDPPAGSRLGFPVIPDAREMLQNEERLAVETAQASDYLPGDVELALPADFCPTSALYTPAWNVKGGRACGQWEVTARDRKLTL